jgi:hypothetical protein
MNSMRIDIQILDNLYQKWIEEDQTLNGVLNSKITKQLNMDFRYKIESWKRRKQERKVVKANN